MNRAIPRVLKTSIFRYLVLSLLLLCAGRTASYGQEPLPDMIYDGIESHHDGGNAVVLDFTAVNPTYVQRERDGEAFFEIGFDGFQKRNRVGEPAVPVYTTLLDLTGRVITRISISDIRSERVNPASLGYRGKIYPRQPALTKNQDPQKQAFVIKRDVYSSRHAITTDTVTVEHLGIIRGQELALLTINPVFYYPADNIFDLITGMKIEIETTLADGKSPSSSILTVHSPKGLIDKGLADYNEADVTPTFSVEPAGLVIVSDTTMKPHLQALAKWKRLKGFRVTELYIGEGGLLRSYASIKDTLNNIWNSTPPGSVKPQFLLLAGDLNIIPASSGASSLSDMYYAEFDGNGDFLPDMYTGRLPASDTTQMKSMVEKILQYEKFEFGDTINHFEKTMLVAGLDAGHTVYMNGQLNYADSYYLNAANNVTPSIFLHENNDSIRTVRYDSVKTLLSSGVGFVNYTGHGSPTSWLYTGIDYTLPPTLTNSSRYPVIISNACETARFSNANNFGAAFLKQNKKGALAFIGCTVDSYWEEDFLWAVGSGAITENPDYPGTGLGFYDRLFHQNGEQPSDWYTSLGQIIYAGNLAVLSTTSDLKKYYWEYYHLLGDPSIVPYIGTPGEFSPGVPDSIPPALKTLSFNTVPFAYAAISDFDTLWDASSVSPSGSVLLTLPDIEKDSCLLVITGQNRKPYFKTIYFAVPDTAWVNIVEALPNDSRGNNNGMADFGDTVTFDIEIQNAGLADATDVYIKLESDSKYLVLVTDSVGLGNITALSELQLTDIFKIVINDSIPDLVVAHMVLKLGYGTNSMTLPFDLTLHSPIPVVISSGTDDTVSGNGNRLPEPGEDFDITIRYYNGGSSALDGEIRLETVSPWLTLNQNLLPAGVLEPGDTATLGFSASLSPSTPDGVVIEFMAEYSSDPYSTYKLLSMVAGGSTEDFEGDNFNSFPWENDPVYPWVISDYQPYSNIYSARSGLTTTDHNRSSSLSLILNMPVADSLSFWYRVSSEYWASDPEVYGDHFIFEVDGKIIIKKSGEHSWQKVKIGLKEGIHRLVWKYRKDANTSTGEDRAWIDLIRFPRLSFIEHDVCVDSLSTPDVLTKDFSLEMITAEVVNFGRDTVYTIPLSYSVNGEQAVEEVFNVILAPGDTASLAFAQSADLDAAGEYTLDIFRSTPDNYPQNDTLRIIVLSTGVNDIIINGDGFTIGENPVRDYTSIEANHGFSDVVMKLFDSKGRISWSLERENLVPGERITLPFESKGPGLYILRIRTGEGVFSYKLIKW